MRVAIVVVYVTMAVWLLIASAGRIVLELAAGQDLDALPFISGALGLGALLLLLPAWDDRRRRDHD